MNDEEWRVRQEASAGLVEAAYLRGEVDATGRPERAHGDEAGGLSEAVESLAVWLYERSGGIFWRGETTWQDRHREEARQWFAYADLLSDSGWLADVAETNLAAYEHAARRPADEDALRAEVEALHDSAALRLPYFDGENAATTRGYIAGIKDALDVLARHPAPSAPATVIEEWLAEYTGLDGHQHQMVFRNKPGGYYRIIGRRTRTITPDTMTEWTEVES